MTDWRFNGISREVFRGGKGGPILTVASPSGSIRKIHLDARRLAEIIEQAARQLRVELKEER